MDGKCSHQVDNLSKLTKIEDLRIQLEEALNVPPSRQKLFFYGKQLEDGHTLFDYNVKLNCLIQVMVLPPIESANVEEKELDKVEEISTLTNISDNSTDDEKSKDKDTKEELKSNKDTNQVNEPKSKPEEGLQEHGAWKVGDLVDAKDLTMGAWFEGIVKKISADENNHVIFYVVFEGYDEDEIVQLCKDDVRPRARRKIPIEKVEVGQIVMVNYNCDEPKERGFWYDIEVTRKPTNKRRNNELYGRLLLGKAVAEECKIIFTDEIFQIEKTGEQDVNQVAPEKRKVKPDCDYCKDEPTKNCKQCGCHVCGEKDEPERQLMCDECDLPYHMKCLNPPLTSLPEEDDWYCPKCKNDGSAVIKAGQKLKESSKKAKMASANSKSNRDWGKGMACVGRTKVCTIVPPNHFGPIPGVPVGSRWKYRVQASEAGVHRPHVSGMHGRDSEGAYSIVLAGGYEDDTDDGEEFTYTGSGGRDLSGNKRTAEQSFDQTLTKTNRALAKNCDCPVDAKKGGEAKDWKKGKPIRVLRSYKFAKHSEFAPDEGVRYDGIYKVIKYWPEKGQSGFIVWRYRLRRDDKNPAPWTEAGKKTIAELGLEIQYPDGYLEAQAKKEMEKNASKGKRKRKNDEESADSGTVSTEDQDKKSKKVKADYKVSSEHMKLIKSDQLNEKTWLELVKNVATHRQFLQEIEDRFLCICCQEVVHQPVTIECGHSTCKPCLQRAFKAELRSCPSCRFGLEKDFKMSVNQELYVVLKTLFPGYDAGR